jgi:hypothetical protein
VLSLAEEFLIQQTSIAPMVLQLKGEVYARAFGVNYVYLLWALVYEAVLVVCVPVYLVELVFPDRRAAAWLSRGGLIAVILFFLPGALLAWFSWTQIARPKVFHVPAYHPSLGLVLLAVAVIAGLLFIALGSPRQRVAQPAPPRIAPAPWVVGVTTGLAAVIWYGLVLLGFGIAPAFPPVVAIAGGLVLVAAILLFLPRWAADARWNDRHLFAAVGGAIIGSMLIGFVGFVGAAPADLWFKVVVNAVALALLVALGRRVVLRP